MMQQDIIPYGQHYRCTKQMLGDASLYAVFEHLLDEHSLYRKVNGKEGTFSIDINTVASASAIMWRTAKTKLQILENIGLIHLFVNDKNISCSINEAKYISLLQAFIHLNKKNKENFKNALLSGNWEELEKLGYVYHPEWAGQMVGMKGEIAQPYAKLQTSMQNDTLLCQLTQVSVKKHTSMQNDTDVCKKTDVYAKLHRVVSKSNQISNQIADFVTSIYDKNELLSLLEEDLGQYFDSSEDVSVFVEELYSGEELQYSPYMFLLTSCLCKKAYDPMQKSIDPYAKKHTNPMQKSITEININKYLNKKINQENEKIDSIEESESIELPSQLNPIEIRKRKTADYPIFPAEDILDFENNLPACLDRSDKLFINRLWNALEFYAEEEFPDPDREGEFVTRMGDRVGLTFFQDELEKILEDVYQEVGDALANGYVEDRGVEMKVAFTEIFPVEKVWDIVGWRVVADMEGEPTYVVSQDFNNIYAEPVAQGEVAVDSKEENRRNTKYVNAILKAGLKDDTYDKLTQIEQSVRNFIVEFMTVTEDGIIDRNTSEAHDNTDYVNSTMLRKFVMEEGITEQDIFDVLIDSPENGGVNLKLRMFSASKIQRWNAKHSQASFIKI